MNEGHPYTSGSTSDCCKQKDIKKMAKKENVPVTQIQPAQAAQAPVTQPETLPAPPDPAPEASAMVPAPQQDLSTVDDGVTLLHLLKVLPHKEKKLRRLVRVTDAEFDAARSGLSVAAREAFDNMLERMSPEKDGVEDDQRPFRPFQIKLKQNSSDENCPTLCDVGGLWTSDGLILTAPTDIQAKKGGVSVFHKAVILSIWKGRVMFAPRVDGKSVPLPQFGDANVKLPYCQSMDRVKGAPVKFAVDGIGECTSCPYQPWKVRGEPNLCQNSVTAVLVLYTTNKAGEVTGFNGLYEVGFSKTSEPAGNFLNDQVNKWKASTDHLIELGAKMMPAKEGQSPYYIFEPRVVLGDDGKPFPTPASDVPMLKLLYRKLMTDYYYPRLAYTYRRSHQSDTQPTGTADMGALEKHAAAAADMRGDNV